MKRTSPTYPSIAMCLIGAASAMTSIQVGAFQLGQIQGTSRLGEPLAAQINIMMSPRETLLGTKLDVLPDFDYRNDPIMKDALQSITAKLVQNQYGQHYIALTSTRQLNVPLLAFRLKAANGDNILIQRYSLSPPPAIRPQAQSTTGSAGRRRSVSTSETFVASPNGQLASISGNEYGPVKAGDTLWKIASKVVGKEQAGTILNQLFELNPHAFINGDINKLKQGVTLAIPTIEGVASTASTNSVETPVNITDISATPTLEQAVEVPSEVSTLSAVASDSSEAAAEAITTDVFEDAVASLESESDIQSTVVTDTATAAASNLEPIDWRAENPELSDKLNQLSDKYAALRARYQEQSGSSIDTSSPAVSEATATAAFEETFAANLVDESALDPSQVTVSIEKTGSAAANAQQTTDNNLAPTESESASLALPLQEETIATGPSRFELPQWALMLIGLGLVLSAAGYFIYRTRTIARRKAEQLLRKEKDNSLKQELAKKAQHRISMEDEVERMLHEQVEEEDGDEIEKTMQLHVDELMSQQTSEPEVTAEVSDEESAESRIDASISHGRYSEAEDLLREVISNYPRNFNAKLRLAEVFYITEKINDFVSISQDIHAHHRPDISDEDWRRVMRMGKMIAPEQPPFSGPQSIMDDVSAG